MELTEDDQTNRHKICGQFCTFHGSVLCSYFLCKFSNINCYSDLMLSVSLFLLYIWSIKYFLFYRILTITIILNGLWPDQYGPGIVYSIFFYAILSLINSNHLIWLITCICMFTDFQMPAGSPLSELSCAPRIHSK